MNMFRPYRRWERWKHVLAPLTAVLVAAAACLLTGVVGPSLDAHSEIHASR
ncbi:MULTISPECIES: hypothetical protein [unclassified Achromobacter]|uniref:hypothetical protein n=1 Tax=unclassified Achromobacter TaxID=2626865 RepID=UPI0013037A39|nr:MULTISPECIES: hypothetical protein [unclassified Achromobacter]